MPLIAAVRYVNAILLKQRVLSLIAGLSLIVRLSLGGMKKCGE
jgi:hypothetical protein